ncbi:MAG: hypothetical protein ABI647_23065 [Gemmatimonadota bacterium]
MRAVLLIAGLCGLASQALSAQLVRQRDPEPLERPKPIATIGSASLREALTQLQGVLTARGFTTVSVDWDRGEISAIKRDAPGSEKSDHILLWLERDPVKPAERALVHFQWGRFEPFFGSTEGPVRVKAWPEELARGVAVQDSLVAFAVSRP